MSSFFFLDERTRGWFLVGSPVPMLLIMFGYHRLITKIGPAIMKSRQPFKIDKIVQIYNLAQVIMCGWLAFEVPYFTTIFFFSTFQHTIK